MNVILHIYSEYKLYHHIAYDFNLVHASMKGGYLILKNRK
jgi:hypothetical protein